MNPHNSLRNQLNKDSIVESQVNPLLLSKVTAISRQKPDTTSQVITFEELSSEHSPNDPQPLPIRT